MRKLILNALCLFVFIAILGLLIWGFKNRSEKYVDAFNDEIEQIDLDTIYLEGSGVEVNFSEVILSKHNETRKLIVSEQEAMVSTELTDRIIQKLDFDFLKKTQKVNYTGKGYFVVDLDDLTDECILDDKENKILTIRIGHSYLETIEIDPNKILIDKVKQGLLARGDIELTVQDYNNIEKDLRSKLKDKFDTVENGQQADEIALKMVKEVYEPIVKAIDNKYSVRVEFL